MKHLSERYRLFLGCFIDDDFDHRYKDDVKAYCEEAFFVDIRGRSQARSGIKSLLSGKPVSLVHYQSDEFQNWVDKTIEEQNIEKLFVYSSGISQFVEQHRYADKHRVLDMADVDSDKWLQYANNKPFYSSWIYRREYRLLKAHEQQLLRDFQAITLITDEERDLFKSLSPPDLDQKIVTLGNGVDTDYFSAQAEFDFTDKPNQHPYTICFTGAMDYWANEDAVVWFCDKVWPNLKRQIPELAFYIVGGKPSEKVQALARLDDVYVTGRVVDVRPYIAASQCCVAPMRIARGVQNKVLEAMSMGKSVVMTSMAQEGIALPEKQAPLVSDNANTTQELIARLLKDSNTCQIIGQENKDWIKEHYSWPSALETLDYLLTRSSKATQ